MNWLNYTNANRIGFDLMDQNMLTFGLIMGGVSIISFGIYYYFYNKRNIYLDKDIQNVPDTINKDIQTIYNNLEIFTQSISQHIVSNVQTESNKLIDTALQTDDTM
jgi:hypothetical protein